MAGWYTPALLHFNGTVASTAIVNSNAAGLAFVASGTGQLDNAQVKFGATSLATNGSTGGCQSTTPVILNGPFGIEVNCYNQNAGFGGFAFGIGDQVSGPANALAVRLAAGQLRLHVNDGGADVWVADSGSITYPANQWFALKVSRDDKNNVWFWLDGVRIGIPFRLVGPIRGLVTVGGRISSGTFGESYFGQWYDEFRLTDGIERTKLLTYSLPTIEYPVDQNLSPLTLRRKRLRLLAGGATTSSNVTVALTGVAGTGSAGTLLPANAVSMTGNAGTSAAGTLKAGISPALTGTASTAAVGTLSPASSVPLTGQAGTGAAGTIKAGTSLGVTGNQGSGAAGTLTAGTAPALTGVNAVGAVGTFTPGISIVMLGNQGAGQVGSLTATAGSDVTVALTGVQALGQLGVLVSDIARILTGNSSTGQAGTLAPATARLLAGNQATGAGGTLTPVQPDVIIPLTGIASTGQLGSLLASGGTPAASLYVRHPDDMGVVERYTDNGDGTFSLVLTTVNGAGKTVKSRHFGLKEQFVLQGDGSHARLVTLASLGGSDVFVRHPIDGGITLRYVDMGGGLFSEKVATSGSTGQDKTVRIWEDNGVAQRYVSQGDGSWARLVATAGATGAVVRNRWDGYVFERWTPNGDGTNSQRVQLL